MITYQSAEPYVFMNSSSLSATSWEISSAQKKARTNLWPKLDRWICDQFQMNFLSDVFQESQSVMQDFQNFISSSKCLDLDETDITKLILVIYMHVVSEICKRVLKHHLLLQEQQQVQWCLDVSDCDLLWVTWRNRWISQRLEVFCDCQDRCNSQLKRGSCPECEEKFVWEPKIRVNKEQFSRRIILETES